MEPDSKSRQVLKNPQSGGATDNKKKPYWKAFRIAAIIGIIEAFSAVLWLKIEDFEPESAFYIRWLAGSGILSGGAFLAHKLVFGSSRRLKISAVWAMWGVICLCLPFLKSPQIPETPQVSLELGSVPDPKDPWGTSFVIVNEGKNTISNVWAMAYPSSPEEAPISLNTMLTPTPELLVARKQSLHFRQDGKPPTMIHFSQKTFLTIAIFYTSSFSSIITNRTFGFVVVQDTAGNYQWNYAGEGRSFESLLKGKDVLINIMPAINAAFRTNLLGDISEPLGHLMETIPFIAVNVNSVEDISNTNKNYPFKLIYSWGNFGGAPASDVYIEWSVLNKQGDSYWRWDHHGTVMREMLLPGASKQAYRMFTEDPQQDVFDGIMSGRLSLAGFVSFKDANSKNFEMNIEFLKTSGIFQLTKIKLGKSFGNLGGTASHLESTGLLTNH